jgi:hypothetical protein
LMRRNESAPFSHFGHAVYDRLCICFCKGRRRPRVQPVKNINRDAWINCADAFGFGKIGDEENFAY